MTRRLPLLLTLLSSGALASPAAHGRPRAGILPVSGPVDLAEQLARELPAALASGHGFAPPDTVARRMSQNPDVARSFLAVRAAVERAEQETLYMRRTEALRAAQRAVDSLDTVAGRHHAPSLAARVRVAQALALLLSPSDEQRALTAFRLALRADPTYQPDPDRLPSRAARLLARARRSIPAPAPPTAEELATLAVLARLDRVVWTGLRPTGGRVELELVLYDHDRRRTLIRERSVCAPGAMARIVARRLEQQMIRPSPPVAGAASRPTTTPPRRSDVRPRGSPWYRRWWVWAIAGTVVVGAGVTAAVVATSRDRSYEFRFSY